MKTVKTNSYYGSQKLFSIVYVFFLATTLHLFTAITKIIPALLPCCYYLLKTTKSFKFCWCHYCMTASLCMIPWFMACLRVWLRMLFKVFFMPKCIKMMFFIFKKSFLRSAHQNDPKHTKKLIFSKNNFLIFWKHRYNRVYKRSLNIQVNALCDGWFFCR